MILISSLLVVGQNCSKTGFTQKPSDFEDEESSLTRGVTTPNQVPTTYIEPGSGTKNKIFIAEEITDEVLKSKSSVILDKIKVNLEANHRDSNLKLVTKEKIIGRGFSYDFEIQNAAGEVLSFLKSEIRNDIVEIWLVETAVEFRNFGLTKVLYKALLEKGEVFGGVSEIRTAIVDTNKEVFDKKLLELNPKPETNPPTREQILEAFRATPAYKVRASLGFGKIDKFDFSISGDKPSFTVRKGSSGVKEIPISPTEPTLSKIKNIEIITTETEKALLAEIKTAYSGFKKDGKILNFEKMLDLYVKDYLTKIDNPTFAEEIENSIREEANKPNSKTKDSVITYAETLGYIASADLQIVDKTLTYEQMFDLYVENEYTKKDFKDVTLDTFRSQLELLKYDSMFKSIATRYAQNLGFELAEIEGFNPLKLYQQLDYSVQKIVDAELNHKYKTDSKRASEVQIKSIIDKLKVEPLTTMSNYTKEVQLTMMIEKFETSDPEVKVQYFKGNEKEKFNIKNFVDKNGIFKENAASGIFEANVTPMRNTKAIFVMTYDREIYIHFKEQKNVIHHSSLAEGLPIQTGGEIFIDKNGKIYQINNNSGHYAPDIKTTQFALERLVEVGLLPEGSKIAPITGGSVVFTNQGITLGNGPQFDHTASNVATVNTNNAIGGAAVGSNNVSISSKSGNLNGVNAKITETISFLPNLKTNILNKGLAKDIKIKTEVDLHPLNENIKVMRVSILADGKQVSFMDVEIEKDILRIELVETNEAFKKNGATVVLLQEILKANPTINKIKMNLAWDNLDIYNQLQKKGISSAANDLVAMKGTPAFKMADKLGWGQIVSIDSKMAMPELVLERSTAGVAPTTSIGDYTGEDLRLGEPHLDIAKPNPANYYNNKPQLPADPSIAEIIKNTEGVNILDQYKNLTSDLKNMIKMSRGEEFNKLFVPGSEGSIKLNNWLVSFGNSMRAIGFAAEDVTIDYNGERSRGLKLTAMPDFDSPLHNEIKGLMLDKGAFYLSPLFDIMTRAGGLSFGGTKDKIVRILDNMGREIDFMGRASTNRLSQSVVWIQSSTFFSLKLNTPTESLNTLKHEMNHHYDLMDSIRGVLNPAHAGVNGSASGYTLLELTELKSWAIEYSNSLIYEQLGVKMSDSGYINNLTKSEIMANEALELVSEARNTFATKNSIKNSLTTNELGWARIGWGNYKGTVRGQGVTLPKYWVDLSGYKVAELLKDPTLLETLFHKQVDSIQSMAEMAKTGILTSSSVLDYQKRVELGVIESQFQSKKLNNQYYDPSLAKDKRELNSSIEAELESQISSAKENLKNEKFFGNFKQLVDAQLVAKSGVTAENKVITNTTVAQNLKMSIPTYKSPTDAKLKPEVQTSLQQIKDSISKFLTDFTNTKTGMDAVNKIGGSAYLTALVTEFIDGMIFKKDRAKFANEFYVKVVNEISGMIIFAGGTSSIKYVGAQAAVRLGIPLVLASSVAIVDTIMIGASVVAVGSFLKALYDLGGHIGDFSQVLAAQNAEKAWAINHPNDQKTYAGTADQMAFKTSYAVAARDVMQRSTFQSDLLSRKISNYLASGGNPNDEKAQAWAKGLIKSDENYLQNQSSFKKMQNIIKSSATNNPNNFEGKISLLPSSVQVTTAIPTIKEFYSRIKPRLLDTNVYASLNGMPKQFTEQEKAAIQKKQWSDTVVAAQQFFASNYANSNNPQNLTDNSGSSICENCDTEETEEEIYPPDLSDTESVSSNQNTTSTNSGSNSLSGKGGSTSGNDNSASVAAPDIRPDRTIITTKTYDSKTGITSYTIKGYDGPVPFTSGVVPKFIEPEFNIISPKLDSIHGVECPYAWSCGRGK